MTTYAVPRLTLLLLLAGPLLVSARQTPVAPPVVGSSGDMIDRIFATREFSARTAPPPRWFDGGASYLQIESMLRDPGMRTWSDTTAQPGRSATR